MGGRIAWLVLLAGLAGCARPNPAYGDLAGSGMASGSGLATGGTGAADGTTKGATSLGTAATSSPSAGPGSSGDSASASSMGPGSASTSDDTTSETATDLESLLWISEPVLGDWDSVDDDPCGVALPPMGARCLSSPRVVVGRTDTPIAELPEQSDVFVGPFYAATTGELILESLEDLVAGTVETRFVEALTAPEPALDLYTWRGPRGEEDELNCEDWSTASGNGTVFLFGSGSGAVTFASSAPCISNVRLLCACAASL